MSDNLNQLGNNLKSNKRKSESALNKDRKIIPQVERVRDVMDPTVPFELEFKTTTNSHRLLLDLNFMPPPSTGCCADCSCSICEFFDGGVTETLFITTYGYVPRSVVVFKNDIPTTDFTETDPPRGQITVWAHNNEDIIICYVYDICI